MKRYYCIESRETADPAARWMHVNTYDTRDEAIERLRYEAATTNGEPRLIRLTDEDAAWADGYTLRIDVVEMSEPAAITAPESLDASSAADVESEWESRLNREAYERALFHRAFSE